MKVSVKKTREAFDYQWKNIPENVYLLSNPEFLANCDRYLLEELGLPTVSGLVVDVGCGNGRWTYGFLKLGCEVIAIDYAAGAAKAAKENTDNFADRSHFILADVLHLPFRPAIADVVFSFGVLHHTGNTKKAFMSITPLLKDGALFHVYLYAKESLSIRKKGIGIHSLYDQTLARSLSAFFRSGILSLNQQKKLLEKFYPQQKVHSAFDILSPKIADRTLTEQELRKWFHEAGLVNVKRIFPEWCPWDKTDLHMNGKKT